MARLSLALVALLPLLSSAFFLGGRANAAMKKAKVVKTGKEKQIAVGVIGTGLVGAELLKQIEECSPALLKQNLDIAVLSISKTKPNADGERAPWMLCDDEEGCTRGAITTASFSSWMLRTYTSYLRDPSLVQDSITKWPEFVYNQ